MPHSRLLWLSRHEELAVDLEVHPPVRGGVASLRRRLEVGDKGPVGAREAPAVAAPGDVHFAVEDVGAGGRVAAVGQDLEPFVAHALDASAGFPGLRVAGGPHQAVTLGPSPRVRTPCEGGNVEEEELGGALREERHTAGLAIETDGAVLRLKPAGAAGPQCQLVYGTVWHLGARVRHVLNHKALKHVAHKRCGAKRYLLEALPHITHVVACAAPRAPLFEA
mmetsp:Transcript_74517/g.240957  ORF Transcript_74517/g.240957 Transcript_74517/m.240957 type:complete len:222 (+) Transcript_74517:411-1076(+)